MKEPVLHYKILQIKSIQFKEISIYICIILHINDIVNVPLTASL